MSEALKQRSKQEVTSNQKTSENQRQKYKVPIIIGLGLVAFLATTPAGRNFIQQTLASAQRDNTELASADEGEVRGATSGLEGKKYKQLNLKKREVFLYQSEEVWDAFENTEFDNGTILKRLERFIDYQPQTGYIINIDDIPGFILEFRKIDKHIQMKAMDINGEQTLASILFDIEYMKKNPEKRLESLHTKPLDVEFYPTKNRFSQTDYSNFYSKNVSPVSSDADRIKAGALTFALDYLPYSEQ